MKNSFFNVVKLYELCEINEKRKLYGVLDAVISFTVGEICEKIYYLSSFFDFICLKFQVIFHFIFYDFCFSATVDS